MEKGERTWCPWKGKKKMSFEEESTENELWQEYYAPYLHFLPFQEVCTRLETSLAQGLTQEEAALRLKRRGKNTLPLPPKPKRLICRYLQYCFSVMGFIILLSSMICFHLHRSASDFDNNPKFLAAGWILLIIFFLVGIMPLLHEDDDEALRQAIKYTMPEYCTVIRGGKKEIILTQDVVIGDVVPISYGQRLPADLRFFSSSRLEVDNVALTGISEPWQIFLLAGDERQMFSHSKIEYLHD